MNDSLQISWKRKHKSNRTTEISSSDKKVKIQFSTSSIRTFNHGATKWAVVAVVAHRRPLLLKCPHCPLRPFSIWTSPIRWRRTRCHPRQCPRLCWRHPVEYIYCFIISVQFYWNFYFWKNRFISLISDQSDGWDASSQQHPLQLSNQYQSPNEFAFQTNSNQRFCTL